MPSVIEDQSAGQNIVGGHATARTRLAQPLQYSGSLDRYTSNDLTPVIGREFLDLQIVDLLNSQDDMIRDLAVTSKHAPAQLLCRLAWLTT